MYNIFRENFESRRIVDLFEISCKVAEVVVFPLDEAADLVSKFGIRNVRTSFVHSSLVAALKGGISVIIPETSPLIASLVLHFGPHNVENQRITRNFLIAFYLDDVASLDLTPGAHLETLRSFAEDKLFYVFVVDFLGRCFKIAVVE